MELPRNMEAYANALRTVANTLGSSSRTAFCNGKCLSKIGLAYYNGSVVQMAADQFVLFLGLNWLCNQGFFSRFLSNQNKHWIIEISNDVLVQLPSTMQPSLADS